MVVAVFDRDGNENAKMFSITFSAYSVIDLNISTTIFEDGVEGTSIGDYLYGRNSWGALREDSGYYNYGMGESKKAFNNYGNTIITRNKRMLEIVEDAFYYIPHPFGLLPDVRDYAFEDELYEYMDIAQEKTDLTVINTSLKPKSTTKYILAAAQKIIVVIKPDYDVVSKFFDDYKAIRAKCIFVILRRQIDKEELRKIRNRFSIERTSFFIVKKTEKFEEAALNGKIYDYLKENHNVGKKSTEYSTVFALKQLAKALYGGEYEYMQGVAWKYYSLVKP